MQATRLVGAILLEQNDVYGPPPTLQEISNDDDEARHLRSCIRYKVAACPKSLDDAVSYLLGLAQLIDEQRLDQQDRAMSVVRPPDDVRLLKNVLGRGNGDRPLRDLLPKPN